MRCMYYSKLDPTHYATTKSDKIRKNDINSFMVKVINDTDHERRAILQMLSYIPTEAPTRETTETMLVSRGETRLTIQHSVTYPIYVLFYVTIGEDESALMVTNKSIVTISEILKSPTKRQTIYDMFKCIMDMDSIKRSSVSRV